MENRLTERVINVSDTCCIVQESVQKVLSGNRVVIPRAWMKEFGLHVGDAVLVRIGKKEILIIPAEVNPKK